MGMCKYRDCKYGVFPRKGTYRRIRQHIAIDTAWNPFLDSDRTMARGEWEPDDKYSRHWRFCSYLLVGCIVHGTVIDGWDS